MTTFSNLDSQETETAFLPRVSIIIPIYNGEANLPALLNCLRSQTYPFHLSEFLLVNNNSSDGTADILKTAAGEASTSGIKLYTLTENQIQSSYAARNQGIRAAQGEILVFTDVDCRPQPNWLERLIQPFINPKVAIVAGEIEGLPGTTLLENHAQKIGVLSQKFTLEHPFCPYGQTANLAIRKNILSKVGLFRPYLTTGGDADICWRILRETDGEIKFAADAIVRHRHRDNLTDFRNQWRRYGKSNRYLHELYGVDLMKECNTQAIFYRLSRWLIKELPQKSLEAIAGKATLIDLIKTPLDLIGWQARTTGQKQVKLPEKARKIEYF